MKLRTFLAGIFAALVGTFLIISALSDGTVLYFLVMFIIALVLFISAKLRPLNR